MVIENSIDLMIYTINSFVIIIHIFLIFSIDTLLIQ